MMCQVLSVSRPDYYRWLHHEPTKRERETKDLKERISRIWLTSEKRYGAGKILRKILQELVPLNRTCSIKRLQRLMKQLGIRSITRKKWRPVTIKEETTQERPNLLKQDFSTNEINQKWCADITYIETQADGWCYLSTIMDLHSKMIIGYSFSKKMDTDLVLRTLEQAISNQIINIKLILHTDQGTQYTSKSYQNRLTELDIQHSFSRKGCPYDNAGIESFHATLKKELVYQCPVYPTFEAAKASLFDYVFRFYNRQRIHAGIDYLTPFEMELKSKQIPA